MLTRINILTIIIDHFRTLRRVDKPVSKMSWPDIFLFLLFPLSVGIVLTMLQFNIRPYIGNLITAVSIFGGFLFNLLAIIYSQIDKVRAEAERSEGNLTRIKKKFVREIHANISFNIVLSIFLVITLILYSVEIKGMAFAREVNTVLLGVNYFLLLLFILTLLMVLNRVYILLKKDSDS